MKQVSLQEYTVETKELNDWLNKLNKTNIPLGAPQSLSALLEFPDGPSWICTARFPNETSLKEFSETYNGMFGGEFKHVHVILDRIHKDHKQDWHDNTKRIAFNECIGGIEIAGSTLECIDLSQCTDIQTLFLDDNYFLEKVIGILYLDDLFSVRFLENNFYFDLLDLLDLPNLDEATIDINILADYANTTLIDDIVYDKDYADKITFCNGNTTIESGTYTHQEVMRLDTIISNRLEEAVTSEMSQKEALMAIALSVCAIPIPEDEFDHAIRKFYLDNNDKMDSQTSNRMFREAARSGTLKFLLERNVGAVCYSKCQLAKWMCSKAFIPADIVCVATVKDKKLRRKKLGKSDHLNHAILRAKLDDGAVYYFDLMNPGSNFEYLFTTQNAIETSFYGKSVLFPSSEQKYREVAVALTDKEKAALILSVMDKQAHKAAALSRHLQIAKSPQISVTGNIDSQLSELFDLIDEALESIEKSAKADDT